MAPRHQQEVPDLEVEDLNPMEIEQFPDWASDSTFEADDINHFDVDEFIETLYDSQENITEIIENLYNLFMTTAEMMDDFLYL